MTPLEIVACESPPTAPAIVRVIGGAVEGVDEQCSRMIRIDRHAIDVRCLLEDVAPTRAAVLRGVETTEALCVPDCLWPAGEIHALRRAWIKDEIVRRVYACGQRNTLPV